jgi:hypothetical protein
MKPASSLTNVLTIVLLLLVAAIVVLTLIRIARERYLQKIQIDDETIRKYQVQVTEIARRRSIQPGMEVDLQSIFKGSRLREPDRRAIIQPLLEQNVFGWYVHTSTDGFENFLAAVGKMVWNPTRTKVVVSQWVRDKRESTQVIIERAFGPMVFGDVDNSTTYGNRAGRDVIGGDRGGRDKVNGDATHTSSGGDMAGSGNKGPTHFDGANINSGEALSRALQTLTQQAISRGEDERTVDALQWAARMAASSDTPAPQDIARHQRILDRAPDWLRENLTSIVGKITGALTGHWLVELLRG